ncbi:unnamed protein product [Heligmosomoides polygyrus]|uniref:Riboflavin transporter n=1 Tax=Heligmosomoides polygyrus TaxID=6339 RepID=A0A183GTX3_HELPZ|nr:unnamed protein product [Heligmosomoides polygyrus]
MAVSNLQLILQLHFFHHPDLSRGWGLPSFLVAVVQIPLLTVPTVPLIIAFLILVLASLCKLNLAFVGRWTTPIGGRESNSPTPLSILLSLLRGAGKHECKSMVPLFAPLQFRIFVRTAPQEKHKDRRNSDSSARESTSIKESRLKSSESYRSTNHYYAALPFSRGIALADVVLPPMPLLSLVVIVRPLKVLVSLRICFLCVTAFVVYLASVRLNLIFNSITLENVLSAGSALLAAGVHSPLRVMFVSLLREGEQSESSLLRIFSSSAEIFPLVNIVHYYTSVSMSEIDLRDHV